jgi:hypothetical protein
MILSRIAQALRQQNWVAVLLELAIVVVGVFIGMQVSNWNAMQADKRLGRAYTERLTEDLQKDLAVHRKVMAYYSIVLESVERTNALLADPRPDARLLVMHAYRATEVVNSPITRATWDEVVSSGDTGLLPRAVLESGIAAYFEGAGMRDPYERLVESVYRKRVRATIPLEVQKAIRAGCSDLNAGSYQVIGFVEGCTIAVDDRVLAAAAAALRADPQVAAELRWQYSMLYSTLGVLASNVNYLETALAALGAAPATTQGALP